jgi:hypothetical protein
VALLNGRRGEDEWRIDADHGPGAVIANSSRASLRHMGGSNLRVTTT